MSELQPARRLGRGLSALLGGGAPAHQEVSGEEVGELRHIAVSNITRNPFQPRKDFDAESLGELASSVREHGVLQPLLVREADGGFQLVAGERRWLAAQKAGLISVPCRVVDVVDKTACEFALEENLKRKDLNDLEKAQAFKDYLSHFECTVEELGKQLSMSRSAISNMLRLLELAEPVKQALHAGKITAGHARALLPLPQADQPGVAERIQAESLTVRQIESLVRELLGRPQPNANVEAAPLPQSNESDSAPAPRPTAEVQASPLAETVAPADAVVATSAAEAAALGEQQPEQPANEAATLSLDAARTEQDELRTNHVISLEEQLSAMFGVKVQIKLKSKDTGFIVIPFSSTQEFERVLKTARRAG